MASPTSCLRTWATCSTRRVCCICSLDRWPSVLWSSAESYGHRTETRPSTPILSVRVRMNIMVSVMLNLFLEIQKYVGIFYHLSTQKWCWKSKLFLVKCKDPFILHELMPWLLISSPSPDDPMNQGISSHCTVHGDTWWWFLHNNFLWLCILVCCAIMLFWFINMDPQESCSLCLLMLCSLSSTTNCRIYYGPKVVFSHSYFTLFHDHYHTQLLENIGIYVMEDIVELVNICCVTSVGSVFEMQFMALIQYKDDVLRV